MKVAVCGSFKMSDKLKKVLDDNDIEVKYFVNDPPADDPGGGVSPFF